jgi:hypothetical protein
MGFLTARRSPNRGRAIVVSRARMPIDVAAAGPVGWEHGLTVEAAPNLADG